MSFDEIEQLKREWTDKYVMVDEDLPELRRFAGRTGIVKTVNMSGRALVEFQYRASTIVYPDISWYDIDPAYLRVVDKPVEPAEEKAPAEKPAAKETKAAPAKKPAAAKGGRKKSPLERAREEGAAQSGAGSDSKPSKAEESKPAGKKLSPLERARQEGAAKRDDSQDTETQPAETESAESTEQKPDQKKSAGKKLSPLERARQEGPAKRD